MKKKTEHELRAIFEEKISTYNFDGCKSILDLSNESKTLFDLSKEIGIEEWVIDLINIIMIHIEDSEKRDFMVKSFSLIQSVIMSDSLKSRISISRLRNLMIKVEGIEGFILDAIAEHEKISQGKAIDKDVFFAAQLKSHIFAQTNQHCKSFAASASCDSLMPFPSSESESANSAVRAITFSKPVDEREHENKEAWRSEASRFIECLVSEKASGDLHEVS